MKTVQDTDTLRAHCGLGGVEACKSRHSQFVDSARDGPTSSELPSVLAREGTIRNKRFKRPPTRRKLHHFIPPRPKASRSSALFAINRLSRCNLHSLVLVAILTQLIIAHNHYSISNCLTIERDRTARPANAPDEPKPPREQKEEDAARFAYDLHTIHLEEVGQFGRQQAPIEGAKQAEAGKTFADTEQRADRRRQRAATRNLARKILEANPSKRGALLLEQLQLAQLDYQLAFLTSLAGNQTAPNRPPGNQDYQQDHDDDGGRRPKRAPGLVATQTANQVLGQQRTNVVIKAFNYKLRLNLELNDNLFGPNLIQKHFLPKGGQQISTQKIEHCYYHARSEPLVQPAAIGAFRTCNGLSGIIHVNNESFVIHPFYDANELNNKRPHIIYRYQADHNQQPAGELSQTADSRQQFGRRQCGTSRLHEWALRQYNKMASSGSIGPGASGAAVAKRRRSAVVGSRSRSESKAIENGSSPISCERSSDERRACDKQADFRDQETSPAMAAGRRLFQKRDVSLTEKYIELALILSKDMFDKRNSSSRTEVLHDAIQVINCLDLYFRSANTRVALIYVETWANGDQIDISTDAKQTLYNFLEYSTRKLYKVSMDAVHLLTGGFGRQFDFNEVGMSIPDSICSSRAVSVSQEANVFEPFIVASTMAHMLGHNLGMEHDEQPAEEQGSQSPSYLPFGSGALKSAQVTTGLPAPTEPDPLQTAARAPIGLQQHHKLAHGEQQPATENEPGDQEEQDDEIKSRSIKFAGREPASALAEDAQRARQFPLWQEAACQSDCLMGEQFNYVQPPVSIGNMILQQVAAIPVSANQSGSPVVTMYNLSQEHQQLQGQTGGQLDVDEMETRQQSAQGAHLTVTEMQTKLQPAPSGSGRLPFRFSRKSLDTYHRLLRLGQGICLFNKPNQLEDFKSCGNGIVDKGEDCDCGSFKECLESDSCCDPITCRFKADAECINGSCCDRCKLRPKGFVCRKARGECDLAELCDGKSGQCAPDVHKHNGHSCQTGHCYLGQCPSHDQQCAELWGSDARKSDRLCYATFNANGTIRGNCGHEGYSARSPKYRRCDSEHLMCGTLQCQLGDMKPVTAQQLDPAAQMANNGQQQQQQPAPSQAEFSKKTLHTHDGQHHECKVITGWSSQRDSNGQFGPSQTGQQTQTEASRTNGNSLGHSSISYVRDGSKCAPNKVCFNQTCQPLELVYRDAYELCPRDEKGRQCSANGVCSTANRCHCEPTWAGHDCSQRIAVAAPANLPDSAAVPTPIGSYLQQQAANGRLAPLDTGNAPRGRNSGAPDAPYLLEAGQPSEPKPLQATTNLQPADSATDSTANAAQAPSTTQSSPAPQPTSSPSSAVPDKKKHDAFGAPTLVLILVAVVAAVFIGFATMANCYRRKGFLKPDKVLRHHQMNCKMDALRSSFIAKRLADADLGRGLDNEPNVAGLASIRPGGAGGLVAQQSAQDLLSPFLSPASLMQQANGGCQHQNALCSADTNRLLAGNDLDEIEPPMGCALYDGCEPNQIKSHNPFERAQHILQPQQRLSVAMNLSQQQSSFNTALQSHRYGAGEEHRACIHRQQQLPPEQVNFNYKQDNDDRAALIMAPSGGRPRAVNQLGLRSFQGVQPGSGSIADWRNTNTLASNQQVLRRPITMINSSQSNNPAPINRATSLGSVHTRQSRRALHHQADEESELDCDQGEPGERASSRARHALATPLRSRANRVEPVGGGQHCSRRTNSYVVDDSCSAPSSPDHRNPYWSASSSRLAGPSSHQVSYHEEAIMSALTCAGPTRHPNHQHHHHHHGSHHNQSGSQRPSLSNVLQATGGGSTEATRRALDQAMRQFSLERHNMSHAKRTGDPTNDDDDDDDMPPLPPPPPPICDDECPLARSGSEGPEEDADSTGSSMVGHSQRFSSSRVNPIKTSAPMETSAGRSPANSIRTIKRVPLNSSASEQAPDGLEQLSLIAQLQQLERVQSLHTKQVAMDGKRSLINTSPSGSDGLHEFFSLPLSVQLSALLARSLNHELPFASYSTPIDDFLNTLNNSNVATSSRRSFKKSNQQVASYSASSSTDQQQQQLAGTWSGSQAQSRRQQMKLQNLQGLIFRLQKLHSLTVEELSGNRDNLDEQPTASANWSGREQLPSQSRSSSRANQTADDLATVGNGQRLARDGANDNREHWNTKSIQRRPLRSRQNSGGSKNESVYSMSDSEDGAFASGIMSSYRQQKATHATGKQNEAERMIKTRSNSQIIDCGNSSTKSSLSARDLHKQHSPSHANPESSVSPPSSNTECIQSSSVSNEQQNKLVAPREDRSGKQETAGSNESPPLDD